MNKQNRKYFVLTESTPTSLGQVRWSWHISTFEKNRYFINNSWLSLLQSKNSPVNTLYLNLYFIFIVHFFPPKLYRMMHFFPPFAGLFTPAKSLPVSIALFLFMLLKFSQMELFQALISVRYLNSWDCVVSEFEGKDL